MTAAKIRRFGLFGGPLLGLLCYHLLPLQYSTGAEQWVEFSVAGRATLGMMIWMATWWITEAVDIEVTALLPIATFPLLGIAPLNKVLPPYAADVIFLFMGGFIIGLAIERWGPRAKKWYWACFPSPRFSGPAARRVLQARASQSGLKPIVIAGMKPLAGLSDTGIAMLAAMALFLIPVDRANCVRAMDWKTAEKLPWGVC